MSMTRYCTSSSPSLATTLDATPEIAFAQFAGGAVNLPADSSITTLTYYGATTPGGDFVPLYDSAGTALVQTVTAGQGYAMPDAVYGWAALKIVVDNAGPVSVSLKG
jgi:hypothetical protein